MLSVIMQNVKFCEWLCWSVIILRVFILNVVLLIVMAPFKMLAMSASVFPVCLYYLIQTLFKYQQHSPVVAAIWNHPCQ
jgi:hypothetical protein